MTPLVLIGAIDPHVASTLWTAALAVLASLSCALVGCFLVLRRMGLLGDAISHAVLPGLVIGFVLSGSLSLGPMLVGAMAAGLLTAFLSEALRRTARLESSASMGVVFTALFSLGVILINLYAHKVDLDAGCVLYGSLGVAALKTTPLFGMEVPTSLLPLAGVLASIVCAIALFWKELKISSFDPALATTLGISAGVMHYLLMALVSFTTVACFEAVGSILVIAMLIVPGAIAHLLTDRLWHMLVIAAGASVLSAVLGIWLAVEWNTNEAGTMSVAAGGLFALAVFFAPRHGVLAKGVRQLLLALRIAEEDLLGQLYRAQESAAEARGRATFAPRRTRLVRWLAELRLRFVDEVIPAGPALRLTATGERRARHLVRSHRLWETYLADRLALPADHLHEPAHRMEHYVSPTLAEALAERLGAPAADPHGRKIPDDEK